MCEILGFGEGYWHVCEHNGLVKKPQPHCEGVELVLLFLGKLVLVGIEGSKVAVGTGHFEVARTVGCHELLACFQGSKLECSHWHQLGVE